MKILLYNPDNGVTRNFMPHLWMFLLQALTPPGHEVVLIDGNAQPMDEESIARYVREQNIGLVGIGAMTRMIDRLEQRGLLKRVRVADDRRTMKLQLTDEGKALYPTMRASAMEVINGLLRGFTKAEARQLEDFLKRMLENA